MCRRHRCSVSTSSRQLSHRHWLRAQMAVILRSPRRHARRLSRDPALLARAVPSRKITHRQWPTTRVGQLRMHSTVPRRVGRAAPHRAGSTVPRRAARAASRRAGRAAPRRVGNEAHCRSRGNSNHSRPSSRNSINNPSNRAQTASRRRSNKNTSTMTENTSPDKPTGTVTSGAAVTRCVGRVETVVRFPPVPRPSNQPTIERR